jgi:hypothetical protein
MKSSRPVLGALAAALLGTAAPHAAEGQTGAPCVAPMPAGFDWPADPAALYKISGGITSSALTIPGVIDTAAQRRHGWMLFAGATQPAGANADAHPVFHTWYTVEETFDPTSGKVNCSARHPLIRLSLPTQLVIEISNPARVALRAQGFDPSPRFDPNPALFRGSKVQKVLMTAHDDIVAFSHIAFNQPMYDYIRDNQYYSKATLNAAIDPSITRKAIVDPPTTAISLKLSWWPVAPGQLTAVPVWDGKPRFPGDAKNPPDKWTKIVMVDPVGGLPAPATASLGGFDHPHPDVVALNRFDNVKITDEEATLANADFRIKAAAVSALGRPLQADDYLVMTAMHIATREFDPWVFVTFWWTDQPNVGSLASDMPPEVKGAFRNYVMDVSYNINAPKTTDGKAPIAFNPWLELFQLSGLRSQCMACHARAAFGPGVVASFNPKDMSTLDPNGFEGIAQTATDPNYQKGTLSLHRIWTIFTRAQ